MWIETAPDNGMFIGMKTRFGGIPVYLFSDELFRSHKIQRHKVIRLPGGTWKSG